MEIIDAPFRAGDLRHGYQAVADNLPNDPRVHERRGSKKIFFKNFMDARVEHVILPIARRLLRADQAQQASAEGYLAGAVMHEISHGLGPAFAHVAGGRQDIRASIGPGYSGLEEAKADIVACSRSNGWSTTAAWRQTSSMAITSRSCRNLPHGALRRRRGPRASADDGVQLPCRTWRAGARPGRRPLPDRARAHARRDRRSARQLLQLEASGDRAGAEAWFARYGAMRPELAQALESARDIPVDIDPVSDFTED